MVTLDESWTGALRVVGDLELPDHHYLDQNDQCYFMGAYTARASFGHSSTNQIIFNLKKSPLKRNTYEWRHKLRAIREVAAAIRANLNAERLPHLTFVPIPSSKPRGHAEYDDRMTQVARLLGPQIDVRELIVTTCERETRHLGSNTRDPVELRQTLALNGDLLDPAPTEIILLDDVLTTGCSFRVCKVMLNEQFPGVPVSGLFVARRALPQMNFDMWDGFGGL
jgi:hypothetical protein